MDSGLLPFFILCSVLIGALAGFLSGLIGIGGGIVIVPGVFIALTNLGYPADLAAHVAVGTSLAVIFFATLSSFLSHAVHKAVDFAIVVRWGPWVLLGVAGAMVVAHLINGVVIAWFFSGFLMLISLHLWFARNLEQRAGVYLPAALQPFVGLSIGGVSALLGIGGAAFSVPAMLMFRVPAHRAIGTAPAFGALIAVSGAVGSVIIGRNQEGLPPFSLGYVNLAGVALIAPASIALAPVGAKVIHRLPLEKLQPFFAVVLFMLACGILYDLVFEAGS